MSFAENLTAIMAKRGIDRVELAAALRISQQAVGLWMRGVGMPKGKRLSEIATKLRCSQADLLAERPPAVRETQAPIAEAPQAPDDEAADMEHRATIAEAVKDMLGEVNIRSDQRYITFVTDQVRNAILREGPSRPFEDRLADALSHRKQSLKASIEAAIRDG